MKIERTLLAVLMFAIAGAATAADHPSKKLFDTKCASCHGKDLKGSAPMAKVFKVEPAKLDLTGAETAAKSDEELNKVTTKGMGKMPAYEKSLKPAEIAGLTAYIRSITPAKKAESAPAEK